MAMASIVKDDHGFIKDDTGLKPKKGSLRRAFGKACALIALGATMVFYAMGFQIGAGFYNQWQENKAEVVQTTDWSQHKDYTKDLPWAPAGGSLALAFGAGAAGIALGKRKQQSSSGYYGGSSYSSSDDGFWWGYWMGSSNSRSSGSSSSSSSDNGGAAAVLVIGAAAALAVGASVVTYKAMKANFGGPPDPDEETLRPKFTPARVPAP